MIVKKPLLPDDDENCHDVDIVLGGRGIGVEFCVFCTAIRVRDCFTIVFLHATIYGWKIYFITHYLICSNCFEMININVSRVVLAQMWLLVIPVWSASLKVKGTSESKHNFIKRAHFKKVAFINLIFS